MKKQLEELRETNRRALELLDRLEKKYGKPSTRQKLAKDLELVVARDGVAVQEKTDKG